MNRATRDKDDLTVFQFLQADEQSFFYSRKLPYVKKEVFFIWLVFERIESHRRYFTFHVCLKQTVYRKSNPKRLALRSMLLKGKLKAGKIVSTKLTNSEASVLWPDIQNKWNTTGKSGKQYYSDIYFFNIVSSWILVLFKCDTYSFHYGEAGTHTSVYFACSSNPRLTYSYITFIFYRFIQVDLLSSRYGKVVVVVM